MALKKFDFNIAKEIDSLINKKEKTPAQTMLLDVCRAKKGERVLIIANPATAEIAQDLYAASEEIGAIPTLMFQSDKTSFDNANEEVIAAIGSAPDICFSISNTKLGKDPHGAANPYTTEDGRTFTSMFDYLLDGKKVMRAVWTPGITVDMMNRAVNIDYKELKERCVALQHVFENAEYARITAPSGTDIKIPIGGRTLLFDDGDFSQPGTGGNVPSGEVFISPVVGTEENGGYEGTIVFDGSMTFSDGDAILDTPITCKIEKGYITEITGDEEAKRLLRTITEAETRAIQLEKEKKLPEGMGAVYKKNARNIGELGIGLNPKALITGNMLEDEKAFHTCHFAVGENYDNDAPALIHLDGIVREPTITLIYKDGTEKTILNVGNLTV